MFEIKLHIGGNAIKIIRSNNEELADIICKIFCDYWKLFKITIHKSIIFETKEDLSDIGPLMLWKNLKYIEWLGKDNFEYLQSCWRTMYNYNHEYESAFADFIQLSYDEVVAQLVVKDIIE